MSRTHIQACAVATAVIVSSLCPSVQGQSQPGAAATGTNIALGARYQLLPPPGYPHCTDAGDATQLTDGELTEGYFWTQPGTVGWGRVKYAVITIDLGSIQPIGGLSFRTAAGVAGVTWPAAIRIHVSDDGRSFSDLGDLLALDPDAGNLPDTYLVRRFATTRLAARGRYLRLLVIPSGPYTFVDEIEVFRGDDALLAAAPIAPPAGDLEQCYLSHKVSAGMRRRLRADLASLEKTIRESGLDANVMQPLLKQLEALGPRLTAAASEPVPADFKTILPFNAAHADLFRIQAGLWKALGHADLRAWPVCPWDPQDLFGRPSDVTAPISVHTMLGEYRAAAFNLANPTNAPIRVSLGINGIPGGTAPSFITAYRVPWTDTISGKPVASALLEISPHDGRWSLEVPPGLVQQVWLTFHVTDVPAGQHTGSIVVTTSHGSVVPVPLHLHVYPRQFPQHTTLWVGGWSYTDGDGRYGITPRNRTQLVGHLRSRFVNAPWATAQVLMKVELAQEGPPAFQLDTALLDDWLSQWPDARAYLVFLSVGPTFAGASTGTPEFKQRVGSWISAWVRHLNSKGIAANRLGLLLVDEPRAKEHDDVIVPWAEAIRAAEPGVLIWEDPIYRNPAEGSPRMYEVSDILCPNRPMWLAHRTAFTDFYLQQQKKGKTLQLYSCSGPARLLDPYAYYRLQAWHCRQIGATGSFFWAFGDNGKASSWNEYASTGPYTPLFLDADSVTPAKQMEAIRESVEDFEYFVMLERLVKEAVCKQQTAPAVEKARELLRAAPDRVLAGESAETLLWHVDKDRTRADAVRVELLQAMTQLSP